MRKCKHTGHIVIVEYALDRSTYHLANGKVVSSGRGQGELTDKIYATCEDCNKQFTFARGGKLPAWAANAIHRVENHATEDLEEVEDQERAARWDTRQIKQVG